MSELHAVQGSDRPALPPSHPSLPQQTLQSMDRVTTWHPTAATTMPNRPPINIQGSSPTMVPAAPPFLGASSGLSTLPPPLLATASTVQQDMGAHAAGALRLQQPPPPTRVQSFVPMLCRQPHLLSAAPWSMLRTMSMCMPGAGPTLPAIPMVLGQGGLMHGGAPLTTQLLQLWRQRTLRAANSAAAALASASASRQAVNPAASTMPAVVVAAAANPGTPPAASQTVAAQDTQVQLQLHLRLQQQEQLLQQRMHQYHAQAQEVQALLSLNQATTATPQHKEGGDGDEDAATAGVHGVEIGERPRKARRTQTTGLPSRSNVAVGGGVPPSASSPTSPTAQPLQQQGVTQPPGAGSPPGACGTSVTSNTAPVITLAPATPGRRRARVRRVARQRSARYHARLEKEFGDDIVPVDTRTVWCNLCDKSLSLGDEYGVSNALVHYRRIHNGGVSNLSSASNATTASNTTPDASASAPSTRKRKRSCDDSCSIGGGSHGSPADSGNASESSTTSSDTPAPRRGRRAKSLEERGRLFAQRLQDQFGDQFEYIGPRAVLCRACPRQMALSGDFRMSNLRVHNKHRHRHLVATPHYHGVAPARK